MKTQNEVTPVVGAEDTSTSRIDRRVLARWVTSGQFATVTDAKFSGRDLIDQVDAFFAARGWK